MILIIDKGEFLMEKKLNSSPKRDAILLALRNTTTHPSADWIYEKVKEDFPEIGIATVYRNLNQLAEHGIIKKLEHLDGVSRFDHTLKPHYHFICSKCSKVIDIDDTTATGVSEQLSERTGLTINKIDISLRGLCKECLKHNQN